MKKVIVLVGKPGSGKGTRLSEFLKGREGQFEVLSVGNMLRKARKDKTELGEKAASYMDVGALVPDDIINAIVIDGIKKAEKPLITDGFPRTIVQAEAMISAGIYPDIVVHLYVDDEIILRRSQVRITCENCGESFTTDDFKPPKHEGICDKCGGKLSKRKDDDEKIVKDRLAIYAKETYPVLDVFERANVKVCTLENYDRSATEKFTKLLLD